MKLPKMIIFDAVKALIGYIPKADFNGLLYLSTIVYFQFIISVIIIND